MTSQWLRCGGTNELYGSLSELRDLNHLAVWKYRPNFEVCSQSSQKVSEGAHVQIGPMLQARNVPLSQVELLGNPGLCHLPRPTELLQRHFLHQPLLFGFAFSDSFG